MRCGPVGRLLAASLAATAFREASRFCSLVQPPTSGAGLPAPGLLWLGCHIASISSAGLLRTLLATLPAAGGRWGRPSQLGRTASHISPVGGQELHQVPDRLGHRGRGLTANFSTRPRSACASPTAPRLAGFWRGAGRLGCAKGMAEQRGDSTH